MSRYKDISHQKFGRLTALEIDMENTLNNKSGAYWKCQCDCGNTKIIPIKSLTSGNTKSCGCLRKEKASNNTKIDLTNKIFGRLTVIEDSGKRNNGRIIWKCQCNCGNECYVDTNRLTQNNTQSCGCLHHEFIANLNTNNLTNQKFGKLLALYPTDKRIDNKIVWHCQCDCGNYYDAIGTRLLSGHTQSCGCIKSSIGENNIQKILQENNINYIREYIFTDLPKLRYDFYLPDLNILIEFDGEQHYRDTGWGNFEFTQNRDNIKNDYALSHNISLIRIPYYERDNITLDLIFGDKYLIKGE